MRWPEGPPHLALNPPYLFYLFLFLCFLFSFPSLAFNRKTLLLPRKRAFLSIFEFLPLFLLSLFWPPPFSLSLSLSLSCFILFLPSFLSFFFAFFFAFFWFLVFVSFLFLSSLLLFHEKNNQHIKLQSFFTNPFSFLVSCLLFSFKLLFLIFDFS